MSKAEQRRELISNLACALKQFKPTNQTLVNEKNGKPERVYEHSGSAPSYYQLVGIAQAGVHGMVSFLKDHDELKESYQNVTSDAMMAFVAAQKININCNSLSELTDTLIGKFQQALDFIEHLKESSSDEQAKTLCTTFLVNFKPSPPVDGNNVVITFPGTQADPNGKS